MSTFIPADLLNRLHQSKYTYVHQPSGEIYVWHGDHRIKILNFLGEEIGTSTIVNYSKECDYKQYDVINTRDVTLSIDDIVHTTYAETKKT